MFIIFRTLLQWYNFMYIWKCEANLSFLWEEMNSSRKRLGSCLCLWCSEIQWIYSVYLIVLGAFLFFICFWYDMMGNASISRVRGCQDTSLKEHTIKFPLITLLLHSYLWKWTPLQVLLWGTASSTLKPSINYFLNCGSLPWFIQ